MNITITLTPAEARAIIEARQDLEYANADLTAVAHKIKAAQVAAAERVIAAHNPDVGVVPLRLTVGGA